MARTVLKDDPPGAVTSGSAAGDVGDSERRQAFLTPVGTVVVGLAAAEAYAKAYQGRVTADQKVTPLGQWDTWKGERVQHFDSLDYWIRGFPSTERCLITEMLCMEEKERKMQYEQK